MSDKELEEYIKKVEPNFSSHIENGTIEMSNEYYNLIEEKMARLTNKNQELKKENYRLKSEVESLTEFKEEHDIMKHFIIGNKLWENFLNYDEFIKWLRKDDGNG